MILTCLSVDQSSRSGTSPGQVLPGPSLTHNEERRKGRIYLAASGVAEYISHREHCIVRCRVLEARDPCRAEDPLLSFHKTQGPQPES